MTSPDKHKISNLLTIQYLYPWTFFDFLFPRYDIVFDISERMRFGVSRKMQKLQKHNNDWLHYVTGRRLTFHYTSLVKLRLERPKQRDHRRSWKKWRRNLRLFTHLQNWWLKNEKNPGVHHERKDRKQCGTGFLFWSIWRVRLHIMHNGLWISAPLADRPQITCRLAAFDGISSVWFH